jgi:MFS transporter, DHA3 family, macrolide efflux protein
MDRRAVSNMVLMLAGKMVSLFGTFIYNFAIGLYVLKVTGSGLSFATTLMLGILPRVLIGPFVGALADRLNRKGIIIGMDFLSGLIVLSLYMVSGVYGLQLPFIYAAAVLLAVANTFFSVTLEAVMPNLVDDGRLLRINSLSESIASLTAISAPMLGGLVFALIDIRLFLLINGFSFIASGITELFIDFNFRVVPIKGGESKLLADITAGFAYLKENRILLTIAQYAVFLNFFGSMGINISVPYIANTIIGFSPTQYGIIMGFFPGGILIGSILLSTLPEAKSKFKMVVLGTAGFALGITLFGVPALPLLHNLDPRFLFIFYIIVLWITGLSVAFINIPVFVLMQRKTTNEYRGRVFGLLQTAQMAIVPAGLLLAGFLVEVLPGYVVPFISGIGIFGLFTTIGRSKELRTL